MPTHDDFVSVIPDVVGAFGYWPMGEPQAVTGGTLNWNFRVPTDGGDYFVRRYRDDLETQRIRGEHALVRWVAERGVPAPLPEAVEDRSLIEIGGGRWSIFPWIEGEVGGRGTLTPAQATTLGALHGYTQAVLATHPLSEDARMWLNWSKEQSLEMLRRVSRAARDQRAEPEIQGAIDRQFATLEQMDVLPPSAFASLPAQLIHGDFHDHQVLWDGDNIAALVDWEVWRTDSRIWELVRSLAFSQLLDSPRLEDYLAGYREHVRLSEEECRLGLRLWWQSRTVGLWAWQAYFLDGNTRVSRFFPALVAEHDKLANEGWRSGIEERFVKAAVG